MTLRTEVAERKPANVEFTHLLPSSPSLDPSEAILVLPAFEEFPD
jgi:hypothetical protein